jgi:serine/threonine-protein kinase ULK2
MASSHTQDQHSAATPSSSSSANRRTIAQKYVIIKPHIGEGSFAKVYKGKNQETDELVAIKEISWLVIRRRSPEFIARHSQNLRNETDILQSLDHPNIVRLLGHENTPDNFYMILEYCAGGDLAQAMTRRRQEPLEEALARALIKQLAAGLKAMRRLNWVHRDLKPGNLLLSRESLQEAALSDGGLKIGDFGFARNLAPEGLAETWV